MVKDFSSANISKGIGRYIIYLFPLGIFLPMIVTNVLTILLVLVLILNYKQISFVKMNSWFFLVAFLVLFLQHFSGFLYEGTDNKEVYHDIEKKLSFIIIPFALSCMNLKREDLNKVLRIFFHSGVVICSFAFANSLYEYTIEGDFKVLINQELANQISLHPTYLSMYLLFSLSYLLIIIQA